MNQDSPEQQGKANGQRPNKYVAANVCIWHESHDRAKHEQAANAHWHQEHTTGGDNHLGLAAVWSLETCV